ncbi:MAG TPA: response regulator [Gemmatimonadaceae bacterium]|nr:response regulator [Gemmatimonadaceae bacterium]
MPSPLRILIAEDESVTALGLEQDLRSLGHSVIGIAADGVTAVSMARTLSPDLVLLDVRMPHLSGLEAAERIHIDRPVPIIIVTAYSDAETLGQAAMLPVFHYLVKPVTAAQLSAAIAIAEARHEEWMKQRHETDDLRKRLEDRKIIERAKGILMERDSISESAAYKVLQRTSQSRNMTMAELSRSLLAAEELIRAPSSAASSAPRVEPRREATRESPRRESP